MQLPGLRNPRPMLRPLRQDVALDDRDAIERLAQGARGRQPRDAASDDHCMTQSHVRLLHLDVFPAQGHRRRRRRIDASCATGET